MSARHEQPASRVRKPLIARLEALDPCALELLGVLGLENRPLTHDEWRQRAKLRAVVGSRGEPLSKAVFERSVASLREQGLVNVLTQRTAHPHNHVTVAVLPLLHEHGRLEPLAGPERKAEAERQQQLHERGFYRLQAHELATALRLAVLLHDGRAVQLCTDYAIHRIWSGDVGRFLVDALGTSVSLAALQDFVPLARDAYLRELISKASERLLELPQHLLEAAANLNDKALQLQVGRLLVLRGQAERALTLRKLPPQGAEGLSLLAAFWRGDYAEAADIGDRAVASIKRKRKLLPDLEGICHVLATLVVARDDPQRLAAIEAQIDIGRSNALDNPHLLLAAIHANLLGRVPKPHALSHTHKKPNARWISTWLAALHDVWLGLRPSSRPIGLAVALLRDWANEAATHGYPAVARELDSTRAALAEERVDDDAPPTLATAFRSTAPWESALTGLEAIAATSVKPLAPQTQRQLWWELQLQHGHVALTPRIRASERARKGTVVSLSRLLDGDEDCLDEHDQRVLAAAEPVWEEDRHGRRVQHRNSSTLGPRALAALAGHPRVIDKRGARLQVSRGQPRLRTKQTSKGVAVTLEPSELIRYHLHCVREGDCVTVFERNAALERMALILNDGLVVPEAGLERLGRTLARLCVSAGVEVHGDLTPEAEQRSADPRPTLLLGWDGETLSGRVCVAPLGLAGPHLRPGVGNPALSAELREHGQLRVLRCQRDLAQECRRLDALERACPTISSYAGGTLEWRITSLADALEVMVELSRLDDEIVIAWPAGRSLQPPTPRDLEHLQLSVSGQRNWLGVDVQLELDEHQVLSFRQLIDARAGARFVRLDGDRFVALSDQLRRRLDALEPLADRKRERLRASPALLPLLDELSADLPNASFDAAALARLQRLRELASAEPRRPRGFRADLRDYQKAGYTWMWRLAEAELGGCLADDMGLGKTVQALALLSQRANSGPALVVCPTSVVINWTSEASRFAPNLRTTVLAEHSDRAAALAKLGRRDVVVCSYGVLAIEAEALAKVEFATAIFDEAHALKNDQTARTRAARSIRARARFGLSGTPVENRVDELWSLFAVLTPGLLGSKTEFEERFAKPIARGERERTAQLRSLLRPFLLRRTKNQVLDELPARTEITLHIEPRPDEQAYYEALRRRAVEAVERGDRRKKRFRILAEITRLRQAAVDPRLLDKHAAPAGAKIDAIVEQLLALRDEGHRALLFTQFLGSMALLRERLDAANIEYLELDGSTSAAERARRVDAFQAGEADVFMLSLRAGGIGMNLTGADYVLHVDPWWNPAVEDQATDRAHRIGQTRPVTVYRFVTEGSIEEKILALHERKRELAGDILTGLEGTAALNLDELMGLL